MIFELLQWALLHLLRLVVWAEAWLTSKYKGWLQQWQTWLDYGFSLLPWPLPGLLSWALHRAGRPQYPGKAPKPPTRIAIVLPEAPKGSACIQSLAACIVWMAQAGLRHITVYDPQGTVKDARGSLAAQLKSLQRSVKASGLTFAIQAGYPLVGGSEREQGLGSSPLPVSSGGRWGECNGHSHAPDQAPQVPATSAIRVVLLAAEDSYAPILAAAVSHDWKTKAGADAANGGVSPGEDYFSFTRGHEQHGDGPGVPQRRASPSPSLHPPSSQQLPEWISDLNKPLTQQRRTPSFRELKSRIEKPGEAETWGPIRRRTRRGSGRPKFDWQHPFSSAVRWIAPDHSDCASLSASEDFASSLQDHMESPDMHEGVVGNGSLSTCSSLPASEDAYGMPDSHAGGQAFPAISEGHGNGVGAHNGHDGESDAGRDSLDAGQLPGGAAQWAGRADSAYGWQRGANGASRPPSVPSGCISATMSPERQLAPAEWPLGLPPSRSEGLLSEWARGSVGSQSGRLFGLEASYSSEDLLAAFQTELDRSPRKLAKASNGSSDASGIPPGRPSDRQPEGNGDAPVTPTELNFRLEAVTGPDGITEPELVLVYGEVLTLAAFPPWLLRFSEIFHAGQLSSFTRAKLHNILWKYCRTSQRFGR